MVSTSSGAASAVRTSSTSDRVDMISIYEISAAAPGAATRPIHELYNYPVKTVAIIGASSNRAKYGNKALRAFERQGYRVIPINPNEREVEGHRTYASVTDVLELIDMATVYVPPEIGVRV